MGRFVHAAEKRRMWMNGESMHDPLMKMVFVCITLCDSNGYF